MYNIPKMYEIHVTVRTNDVDGFRAACDLIGVKPIVIDLQDIKGKTVFHDVMTSSTIEYRGGSEANAKMESIVEELCSLGFEVARAKIESSPSVPGVPLYWESHIRVNLANSDLKKLRAFAYTQDVHVSRNIFKKLENDRVYMMLTSRVYIDITRGSFKKKIENILADLILAGFEYDKVEIEKVVYDSNMNHDKSWIHGV